MARTAASSAPPGAYAVLPLVLVDQVVQLQQVDVVGPQLLQRAADLLIRGVRRPLSGLGGQEEVVAVLFEERPEPQLCFAVAGGDVDVVDPGRR